MNDMKGHETPSFQHRLEMFNVLEKWLVTHYWSTSALNCTQNQLLLCFDFAVPLFFAAWEHLMLFLIINQMFWVTLTVAASLFFQQRSVRLTRSPAISWPRTRPAPSITCLYPIMHWERVEAHLCRQMHCGTWKIWFSQSEVLMDHRIISLETANQVCVCVCDYCCSISGLNKNWWTRKKNMFCFFAMIMMWWFWQV